MSQVVITPDGKRHIFPNEARPDQIRSALASYTQPAGPMEPFRYPVSFGPSPPGPTPSELGPVISRAKGALGVLPAVGGAAGGMGGAALGGLPGAIGGAAAGGAVAEAARQALVGESVSAAGIAGQGAQQAAYEALGGAIGAGAGRLARPVMRRALQVGKTLTRDFPNAVETALTRGIPVTRAGVAKAIQLRRESGKALISLLAQAGSTGQVFRVQDMVRNANELMNSKVLPEAEKAAIKRQLNALVERYVPKVQPPKISKVVDRFGHQFEIPQPTLPPSAKLTPLQLKRIKQFYQNRAASVYRASKAGALTLAQQNRGLFSEKIAEGARPLLEQIPGVATREAETQALIGAQRATSEAFMRPPRSFELHRPGSYPVLNNPAVVSHTALILASPYFRALARQSPRAAAALLFQLGAQDSTGTTP